VVLEEQRAYDPQLDALTVEQVVEVWHEQQAPVHCCVDQVEVEGVLA